ncbi:MAG TPA: TetR/AcrR family transcriptional regulator [Acidimicrobiales bacterium]|nr:TetR/AcrR family transcriptional regulator [Acidimicrobiales bacterium]
MPRPPDPARRKALLDAVIEAVARGGIGGRSLRDLAEEVGTSHRMLLHHFGSREELLLAVVEEVERRQAQTLATLPAGAGEATDAMWADLRRPELWPFERLFFECYARGAQGEEPFTRLIPAAVAGWLDQVDAVTGGTVDRSLVRLGLAVTRGLLLDLVATGDVEGVDDAAARFADLVRAAAAGGPRRASPGATKPSPPPPRAPRRADRGRGGRAGSSGAS